MVIPANLLKKWKALRSGTDTKKLSERLENSYPLLFSRAFKDGSCSDEVFEVMAKFYEEKAAVVKQYLRA